MTLKTKSDNNKLKKGLYLISTPIGNLKDISLRAIEILQQSDNVLCEDTRVSKNLFNKYHINTNLISNHKFNETKNLKKILDLLKSGNLISLVSDAGTPSISDPGKILINECIKNKIEIFPIPGASAVTSALSISGFSEKFYFYGFMSEREKILNQNLLTLSENNCSVVFFSTPSKFKRDLKKLKNFFMGRKILICREMTKIYEQFIRGNVDDIDISNLILKGEFTIVISEIIAPKNSSQKINESDKKKIEYLINKLSLKEISNLICMDRDISKKEVYDFCLQLKNEK